MITADIEKSFKARLRHAAKEMNRRPDDLWQSLTLERFLVRLARSRHSENFVLKGVCFWQSISFSEERLKI